ncbi:unnamed protein product [Amoebophrya sp. A120]|nr:unnamed protein product [Amoebophrya sp. A120]|eukprot:GSA120T00020231001.1
MPLVECAAPVASTASKYAGKVTWQDSSLQKVWNGKFWVTTRLSTVNGLANRQKDKDRVEQTLGLPEFGRPDIVLKWSKLVGTSEVRCEDRFLPSDVRDQMDAEMKRSNGEGHNGITKTSSSSSPSNLTRAGAASSTCPHDFPQQSPGTPSTSASTPTKNGNDPTNLFARQHSTGGSSCGGSAVSEDYCSGTNLTCDSGTNVDSQTSCEPQIVAFGYERIVYGDHGPYVELAAHQINWEAFPFFHEKPGYSYYDEYYAKNKIMLYAQKKFVTNKKSPPKTGQYSTDNQRPEGYANYVPGCFYIAADATVLMAETAGGKPLVQQRSPPHQQEQKIEEETVRQRGNLGVGEVVSRPQFLSDNIPGEGQQTAKEMNLPAVATTAWNVNAVAFVPSWER